MRFPAISILARFIDNVPGLLIYFLLDNAVMYYRRTDFYFDKNENHCRAIGLDNVYGAKPNAALIHFKFGR
jgi:hypothetical protein